MGGANSPTFGVSKDGAATAPAKDGTADFGPRYKVERLLGQGGMGAVYLAYDQELGRRVALKLVKPELAVHPEAMARFRQELLLASKISHRNILRIHDLGDIGGTKFISMAFVDGEDLHHLLMREGKLPLDRMLHITRQLCAALDAAHSEGVVHRDLKPQNIMLGSKDHVYVSDFGLAKSLGEVSGMTQSGEMLGTPRYMAPEQVEAKSVDARTDIYALGLIFYEMVTGDVPFTAETTLQLMYKRAHEPSPAPNTVVPDVPQWLNNIIMKCLERDPANRYQNTHEILQDIDAQRSPDLGPQTRTVVTTVPIAPAKRKPPWLWVGIAAAVICVLASLALVPQIRHRVFGGKTEAVSTVGKPTTVLVADFSNHTGDTVFDGTLEPMFNIALEGAKFINAYNRGTARNLAKKLPNPTDKLDEQSARLVALSQGINAVITGDISLRGNQYTVSAMALDAATGSVLGNSEVSVANKDDLISAVPKAVAPLRKALGDQTADSTPFQTGAFTAASIEVVHQYGLAIDHQLAGDWQGAMQYFAKAAQLDPSFARAYSGTAAMAYNLGQRQLAEQNIKLAMEHVDRMTEREKYRLRGQYYQYSGENRKAIDDYKELLARYPADLTGQFNLAASYIDLRDFPAAVEAARRAAEIAPKRATMRQALSFYSSYAGDFHAGEQEARVALELSPASEICHLALAEAQLGQGQLPQAVETYQKLEKLSATGASMSASGFADVAAYEGRFSDAVRLLEQGAAADLAAKNPENAADKFVALGVIQLWRGQNRAALEATEKALANSKSTSARFLSARNFIGAGEVAKAQKLASSLASETTLEPQAYAKIIEGDLALKRGDASGAIKALTEANKILDTWIGHYDLAKAYLEAGSFVEADAELDQCIKRKGESLELWLNNMPTSAYFPSLFYLQGRVREGLKSLGFADSYRTYLSIRGNSGEDPLIPEIKKHLGQ